MNIFVSGFQEVYVNEIVKQLSDRNNNHSVSGCIYIPSSPDEPWLKNNASMECFNRNRIRNFEVLEYEHEIDVKLECYMDYFAYFSTLLDRQLYSFGSLSPHEIYSRFIRMIFFFEAMLDKNSIDVILSREIPHFPSEFVLYVVAKNKGIPIYMCDFVQHLSRTILIDDIFDRNIYSTVEEKLEIDDSVEAHAKEIYMKLNNEHKIVRSLAKVPKFESYKEKWSITSWFKYLARDIYFICKKNPLEESLQSISDTSFGELHNVTRLKTAIYFASLRYKSFQLERYYISKQVEIEPSKNYSAVFFAHYQPERTTNPDGGLYLDTITAVRKLKAILPKNSTIYFKEHPHTFSPTYRSFFRGGLARSKSFYNELEKMGIKFLSPYMFNDDIYDNVNLISSITGTVIFESIIKGKKSLMFGNNWIKSFPSVIHIDDTDLSTFALHEPSLGVDEKMIKQVLYDIIVNSKDRLMLVDNRSRIKPIEEEIRQLLDMFYMSLQR